MCCMNRSRPQITSICHNPVISVMGASGLWEKPPLETSKLRLRRISQLFPFIFQWNLSCWRNSASPWTAPDEITIVCSEICHAGETLPHHEPLRTRSQSFSVKSVMLEKLCLTMNRSGRDHNRFQWNLSCWRNSASPWTAPDEITIVSSEICHAGETLPHHEPLRTRSQSFAVKSVMLEKLCLTMNRSRRDHNR